MSKMKMVYIDNEHSQFWLQQKAWAEGILARPDVVFPNGVHSHDAGHKVLEKAELELIDDLALQVYPA